MSAFSNPRARGIIALTIPEGDELIGVGLTEGNCDIFLASKKGKCARFDESEIRAHGKKPPAGLSE